MLFFKIIHTNVRLKQIRGRVVHQNFKMKLIIIEFFFSCQQLVMITIVPIRTCNFSLQNWCPNSYNIQYNKLIDRSEFFLNLNCLIIQDSYSTVKLWFSCLLFSFIRSTAKNILKKVLKALWWRHSWKARQSSLNELTNVRNVDKRIQPNKYCFSIILISLLLYVCTKSKRIK